MISSVEMLGHRSVSLVTNVPQVLDKAITQSFAGFTNVRLFTSLANDRIDKVAGDTGKTLSDPEFRLREGHRGGL